MYPITRVQKRIPDGSVWQRFHGYRLTDVRGVARVYLPVGTPWWNPIGGWVTRTPGISLFSPERPFVISCSGFAGDRRFYIDIVRGSTIADGLIEYLDLYLDVMIDAARSVSEKDEEQLGRLEPAERAVVRRARDDIRARIAASDPLFDPASEYFALNADAEALPPVPLAQD
jgi:hypothetical protein